MKWRSLSSSSSVATNDNASDAADVVTVEYHGGRRRRRRRRHGYAKTRRLLLGTGTPAALKVVAVVSSALLLLITFAQLIIVEGLSDGALVNGNGGILVQGATRRRRISGTTATALLGARGGGLFGRNNNRNNANERPAKPDNKDRRISPTGEDPDDEEAEATQDKISVASATEISLAGSNHDDDGDHRRDDDDNDTIIREGEQESKSEEEEEDRANDSLDESEAHMLHDDAACGQEEEKMGPSLEPEPEKQSPGSPAVVASSSSTPEHPPHGGAVIDPPLVVETITTTVVDNTSPEELHVQGGKGGNGDGDGDDDGNDDDGSADVDVGVVVLDADELEIIRGHASEFRRAGKELHDQQSYADAADKFESAADLLYPTLASETWSSEKDDDITEEFATCRLHEALCRLKAQEYGAAAQACSAVLELPGDSVATTLRARAFFRRAKANVALENAPAALSDARSAAFLGDRKAVALYGKLMREESSSSLLDDDSSASSALSSLLQPAMGSSSDDKKSGGEYDEDSSASSSALLESLLSKSTPKSPLFASGATGSDNSTIAATNPLDSLNPLSLFNLGGRALPPTGLAQDGSRNNKDDDSLAKSVVASLAKRLEDERTQETICRFLQGTSVLQLQQAAGMAGIPVSDVHAEKIIDFCHGVTPASIRKTVANTKRVVYCLRLLRKLQSFLTKYRTIILLLVLLQWIKSALLRPIPVNKRAAAKAAAKAAAAKAAAAKAAAAHHPLLAI